MATERLAPDLGLASRLNPAATPFDTFAPASSQNQFSDLAAALQQFNPSLQKYTQIQQDKADTADFESGRQAYLKAKTGLKDAVNKGVIPAGASPAFQRGYQQSALRVMGMTYDQALRQAYASDPVANNPDPAAFQSWVADFTEKYQHDNNLAGFDPHDIVHTFQPLVDNAQTNLSDFHVQQQQQGIEEKWAENTQNDISMSIDAALATNMSGQQIGEMISKKMNVALENGYHNKAAFNESIVESVTAKALQMVNDDPTSVGRAKDVLVALAHVQTGPGAMLGNTAYAKKAIMIASAQLADKDRDNVRWQWAKEQHVHDEQSYAWAQQERAHTKMEWAKEKNSDAAMRDIISTAIMNPTDPTLNQKINALTKFNPGAAASMFGFKNSVMDSANNHADDPHTLVALQEENFNNPGTFDIRKLSDAFNAGKLSQRTYQNLMDNAKSLRAIGDQAMSDPIVHNLIAKTGEMISGNGTDMNAVDAGIRYTYALQVWTSNWLAKHKDASAEELHKAVYAERELLLKTATFAPQTQSVTRLNVQEKPLLNNNSPASASPSSAQGSQANNPYADPRMHN